MNINDFEKTYCGIRFDKKSYCKNSKTKIYNNYIRYMLDRTNNMFEYKNLPDTIPKRILELYLQINGYTVFAKVNGKLYVFFAGLGGVPDQYYMPTEAYVANPFLKFNKNLKIDEECVVMSNDSLYMGLMGINENYAHLLTENYVSIRVKEINTRITSILKAQSENEKQSAEAYLSNIEDGKLGVILDKMTLFGEGLDLKNYNASTGNATMTELIEMHQYLKASWYNELGLQNNYNMKREAINSAEGQLNEDALIPLLDDMLECRKIGIEKVNKMFGTNISVDFNSAWKQNRREIELELEQLENVDNDLKNNENEEEEIRVEED